LFPESGQALQPGGRRAAGSSHQPLHLPGATTPHMLGRFAACSGMPLPAAHLGLLPALCLLCDVGRLRARGPARKRFRSTGPNSSSRRRGRFLVEAERVGEGALQSDWPGGPPARYRPRASGRGDRHALAIVGSQVACRRLSSAERGPGTDKTGAIIPDRGPLPPPGIQFRLQGGQQPLPCLQQQGCASSGHPHVGHQAVERCLQARQSRLDQCPANELREDPGEGRRLAECRRPPPTRPAWRWPSSGSTRCRWKAAGRRRKPQPRPAAPLQTSTRPRARAGAHRRAGPSRYDLEAAN